MTRVNNGQNETESYTYDANNRLTSVTNGNGKTRYYGYNVRGELYSITLPDLSAEYFSYDGDGNLTLYTHPEGFQIGYVYDNAGRLTKIDYPTGVDTTFSYDDASRLVQMVDSTGTTTWTYNAADQVVTLAQPAGTITYEYDDNARLWKMHQPGSLTTTYTYDFAWRLKQITNGYGEITTFDYDPASRVIKKSFANGTYETYSYDSRSRVEWIKLFNSSNQLLSQHQYTYDASSNVLTRTDNGVTTTFGYDDIGQLISESRPGYSASYTYDKNGNRLTRTLNGVTEVYTYDDADKLLNIKVNGIVVKSFTYDMAGRTTGITDSGGTTTLSYDYEDRLVSISRPGVTTNTFAYNGFGARVSKTDSGGSTTYLRNGTSVVAPVIADSGAVYTPGISERRGSASRFYHGDIKNFVEQTDSSGQIVSSQQYDAFGNPVSSTGSWSGPFAYGGRFGYQFDSDTSLSLLGHRYYDSTTGRFLTRDPIGDGRNWYAYVANNPVRLADPWGLAVVDPVTSAWLYDTYWGIFGEPALDPEGEKVWVGGLINVINPKGNAMTVGGWTLINDWEDFERYTGSQPKSVYWRNHEHRHLWQEEQMGTIWYLVEIVREYARWGHDLAPLEIDAQNNSGDPEWKYRDPWGLENSPSARGDLPPPAHGVPRQPWGGVLEM